MSLAAAMGFAFSVLTPSPACGFPVHLEREVAEGSVRVTVVQVEASFPVAEVAYKVVLLDAHEGRVWAEGRLADADEGGVVAYVPEDGPGGTLRPGDAFLVVAPGDVHLLLLRDGVPLGWTAGC